MKTKSIKRIGDSYREKDPIRRTEEFLYESEIAFARKPDTSGQKPVFGSSHSVRRFVQRMLMTFSPDMGEFIWKFEPYDCRLIAPSESKKSEPLGPDLEKQARAFAMRRFAESSLRREKGFDWPDRTKVILNPKDSMRVFDERYLPNITEIWDEMRTTTSNRQLLSSYSLEVSLTPRILIRRETGTFYLSQLSDGEQRLFSLFVDIARQLSISDQEANIGQGDAIVLIDEIDIHLHPKWQRLIVPALEDLFPNCQFIATTHSPFVIQATKRQQILSIAAGYSALSMDGGNSIEDIAEDIQGISIPQRSVRAETLNTAAKKYFELLELRAANPQEVTAAILSDAERYYRQASAPFTSDPAVHALLEVMISKDGR